MAPYFINNRVELRVSENINTSYPLRIGTVSAMYPYKNNTFIAYSLVQVNKKCFKFLYDHTAQYLS